MNQFYQQLRRIQKKERNNATLASVEETFFQDVREYLDGLKKETLNDPFSKAHGTLREAQRIATEICERREHKITDVAVVNIQRSYPIFSGDKAQFDLVDTVPLNLTPEEEKFYYSLINTLKNHRLNISASEEETSKPIIKEVEKKPIIEKKVEVSEVEPKHIIEKKVEVSEVKSKPIVEKKVEVSEVEPKPIIEDKPKKPKSLPNIEENPNAIDTQDEFYDFESKKIKKDTELVTMLVFGEVDPIIGVDEKIYGPFKAQDVVTMPLVNAKVFFKNRLGRQVKI